MLYILMEDEILDSQAPYYCATVAQDFLVIPLLSTPLFPYLLRNIIEPCRLEIPLDIEISFLIG